MSRLHKKNFSLTKKYYIILTLLIIYGFYKNGVMPLYSGYSSILKTLSILVYPIISFVIGIIFDYLFKNNEIFNSKFYSLLFVMFIPINTNILIYILYLIFLLFFYNYLLKKNIKNHFNFIALGKILLILILIAANSYSYMNSLEQSGLYQYSFADILFGHNVSGLFTSSTILILLGLILLVFDNYYKKEILTYSYSTYLISLVIYSFITNDIIFLLTNMFSSNILFALIYISTLSCYTPYEKNKKIIYGLILGATILPMSLITNFYEGVYISIIFSNLLVNLLELFNKNKNLLKNIHKIKQK